MTARCDGTNVECTCSVINDCRCALAPIIMSYETNRVVETAFFS